jgi:hypothetical protein
MSDSLVLIRREVSSLAEAAPSLSDGGPPLPLPKPPGCPWWSTPCAPTLPWLAALLLCFLAWCVVASPTLLLRG